MRPLDPRLLRYASGVRTLLVAGGVLAILKTASTIALAWLITSLIVGAIGSQPIPEMVQRLGVLALVVCVRGGLVWLTDMIAARGGAAVIGELRRALMNAVGRLGPGWLARHSTTDVALVAGRGLDALEGYFSAYIPQLILTAVATPILLIVIGWRDALSGIILVCTLPLVPLFMVLVGLATQKAQNTQWSALSSVSRGFLDVVEGLPTLKLFSRANRQIPRIRSMSEEYRTRTMRVLRISFVSGFVLEVAAALSVALVAVTIGLRLLDGSLSLATGLFVLILAPEVFLPLRAVGASYHAAAEGIEAASRAFTILDAALPVREKPDTSTTMTSADTSGIRFTDVAIRYENGTQIGPFSAHIQPGEFVIVLAPSGAGKTTLFAAALGFTAYEGTISVAGQESNDDRRRHIAWSGQHSKLSAGTIADNIALGDSDPDLEAVTAALGDAGFSSCNPGFLLAENGAGLSGGEAQRVCLARALYRLQRFSCSVLIVDEPTSMVDSLTERHIATTLRRVADSGVAVVVASHREALLDYSDSVVTLDGADRVTC